MRGVANDNIRKVLEMCDELISLAEEGEAQAPDDGCLGLYARVRDCAYTLNAQAKFEREVHLAQGAWDDDTQAGDERKSPDETEECGWVS